eukprot:1469513-Amphidinium_carterae.1
MGPKAKAKSKPQAKAKGKAKAKAKGIAKAKAKASAKAKTQAKANASRRTTRDQPEAQANSAAAGFERAHADGGEGLGPFLADERMMWPAEGEHDAGGAAALLGDPMAGAAAPPPAAGRTGDGADSFHNLANQGGSCTAYPLEARRGFTTEPLGPQLGVRLATEAGPGAVGERTESSRKLKIAALRERLEQKRGMAKQLFERARERAEEERQEKRSKRSRKRRRSSDRRRRSSDSDTSRSRSADRRRGLNPREIAEKDPGALMSSFLIEINRQLSGHPAELSSSELGRVKSYLQTLYLPRHTSGAIGMRNVKELGVLAEVIDDLANGCLASAGDKLVQRFKAIQRAVADAGWGVAQHLEIAAVMDDNVVSAAEQRSAMREERIRGQLRRTVESSSTRRFADASGQRTQNSSNTRRFADASGQSRGRGRGAAGSGDAAV